MSPRLQRLVDLADAGRTRRGQDLRRRALDHLERAGAPEPGPDRSHAARRARGDDRGTVGTEGDGRAAVPPPLGSLPPTSRLAQRRDAYAFSAEDPRQPARAAVPRCLGRRVLRLAQSVRDPGHAALRFAAGRGPAPGGDLDAEADPGAEGPDRRAWCGRDAGRHFGQCGQPGAGVPADSGEPVRRHAPGRPGAGRDHRRDRRRVVPGRGSGSGAGRRNRRASTAWSWRWTRRPPRPATPAGSWSWVAATTARSFWPTRPRGACPPPAGPSGGEPPPGPGTPTPWWPKPTRAATWCARCWPKPIRRAG
jgi:hypothetical protein